MNRLLTVLLLMISLFGSAADLLNRYIDTGDSFLLVDAVVF